MTAHPQATSATAQRDAAQNVVRNIDAMAQPALGEIGALAQLALWAMESQEANSGQALEVFAKALELILELILWRADDAANFISYEAETVGCHHVNLAAGRRGSAAVLCEAALRRTEAPGVSPGAMSSVQGSAA